MLSRILIMPRTNCTVDTTVSEWIKAALWQQVAVCLFGAICNSISIWCLVGCQRTGKAVKVQLLCIFSLLLAICIVTLPFVTYLFYADFFCYEENIPKKVQYLFSIVNSILLQEERMNFTAIAVYRAAAVCSPRLYKKMVTLKVVLGLQAGIFLYVVPPWIVLGVMLEIQNSHMNGNVIRINFKDQSSHMFKFVTSLYGLHYCLPVVITSVAYTVMMVTMIRQNRLVKIRSNKKSQCMDHVAFTISIIILTNLLLDGPHVVVHLLQDVEVASIVTHMAFFLHIVLDPIIFISVNKNYRRKVIDGLYNNAPALCSSEDMSSSQPKDNGDTLQDNKEIRTTWRRAQLDISQKRNAIYVTRSGDLSGML